MKKMNPNFKILTKKEVTKVKGGGWLSRILTSMYKKHREETDMRADGYSCPPPEPDRD